MKVTNITEKDGTNLIITTLHRNGWIPRLFGLPPSTKQWRGSGTVWHSYPEGFRASSTMERRLCAAWMQWGWQQIDKDTGGEKDGQLSPPAPIS